MIEPPDFAAMTLEEFRASLQAADWTYTYADSFKCWERGRAYFAALRDFLSSDKATAEHRRIYEERSRR